MKSLVFATRNQHKIQEVKAILGARMQIVGLQDIGCFEELPETHHTIEANSMEKAGYVHDKYGVDCFSEDSGLEVTALDGEPGVDSAHYAGTRDADANNALLLLNLMGVSDRSAQFKTVFTLHIGKDIKQFTGIVTGKIADSPSGQNGFGYDPLFVPDGYRVTFAEMDMATKGLISHRGKAFLLLINYLTEIIKI